RNFYISRLRKLSIFQKLFLSDVMANNRIILSSIKEKEFDYVLIIKGDLLTNEFIVTIKQKMPKAKFILYQWDSLKHYNYLDKMKYFNKVFSFDYNDCIRDERILYLPLFFSGEYSKIALLKNIRYSYDLFFLGFNHTIRSSKLFELVKICEEKGLKYSFNIMTSITERIQIFFKNRKINCFFRSIKFEEFSDKYIKSKAIVDISSPNQSGLPIRIIEAVGADKKIITTNLNVLKEDFYDPKMIFIWGRDNFDDLVDFLNNEHEKKDSEKYSVTSFVSQLMSS
ncbi:MAG: hypothetical protein Q8880_13400, partial [Bacteroidota bacterium]|nr:hypothetical protein [Bacteroidota bacterium]